MHINESNKPIYVGKGTNRRAWEKRSYSEPYTIKIVDNQLTEEEALELEEFLISEIGIDNLYNVKAKGAPSRKDIVIDYRNIRQEVSKISKRTPREINKFAMKLIDDAIDGNMDAIKYILRNLDFCTFNKIKDLFYSNIERLAQ